MRRGLVRTLCATALALSFAAPAHAWDDTWAGFSCGLTSTNDPTGQVIQDPNTQTGEVDGGPWVVVSTSGPVESVTIGCTVQINDSANPSTGGTSRSSTTPGNVGVLADTITYTAAPGDDVYLCTDIHWCDPKGCWWIFLDADEDDPFTGYVGQPGNQCALVTSVEAR